MSMFTHIDPSRITVPIPPVMTLPEFLLGTGFYQQVEQVAPTRCLLQEGAGILGRGWPMTKPPYTAVTLWTAPTSFYRHFDLTPRLLITSSDAGHGKSRLARVITSLSKDGQRFETK